MKIDLKHTTKDKLYAMLCEEQEMRLEAEEIMKKQAEHAEKQAKLLDEMEDTLLQTTKNAASLASDLFNANREVERLKRERDDYFKRWQWCVLHPWQNLWKNLVKQ